MWSPPKGIDMQLLTKNILSSVHLDSVNSKPYSFLWVAQGTLLWKPIPGKGMDSEKLRNWCLPARGGEGICLWQFFQETTQSLWSCWELQLGTASPRRVTEHLLDTWPSQWGGKN